MKILMVSPCLPARPWYGAKIRIWNILKNLSKEHDIFLVSAVPSNKETPKDLKEKCLGVEKHNISKNRYKAVAKSLFYLETYRWAKFYSKKMKEKVKRVYNKGNYDVVWINFLNMTYCVPEMAWGKSAIVLDRHNSDSLLWKNHSKTYNPLKYMYSKYNYMVSVSKEKSILRSFDAVLSVSEADKKHTQDVVGGLENLVLAPNGADTDYFECEKGHYDGCTILFCGGLNRRRNIDAVRWFSKKIYPRVRENVSDVRFCIVGRSPDPAVQRLEDLEGIELHPDVADVRPYYEEASVSVCPMRHGGGTKLKLFESFAMEVPVVTTSIHGLEGEIESCLEVADAPDEFARRIAALLRDRDKCRVIGKKGRDIVEENYSWGAITRQISKQIKPKTV